MREQANGALDRFHTPAAVLAFRDALASEDALWRLAAVRAYGDVLRENITVAPFVVSALGDDDAAVARAAESAVAGIPHDRAVPLLVTALQATSSPVRAAAARMLQKRTDKSAVDGLVALVASSEEGDDVRIAARDALKAHAAYVDLPAALKLAADVDLHTDPSRLTALRTVAALGDPGAWTAVKMALHDADATVRVAGARAAADLGGEGAKQAIEEARTRETEPRVQRQLELIGKSIR
jgi:HEAT repeat protein